MLLAAPLLVMSRPIAAWSWAMPFAWRRRAANCGVIIGAAALWHAVTRPVAATFIQLAVLWMGHAPRLFDAATEHPWPHALQHLSFFVAARAFWTAMLAARPVRHRGPGPA